MGEEAVENGDTVYMRGSDIERKSRNCQFGSETTDILANVKEWTSHNTIRHVADSNQQSWVYGTITSAVEGEPL